MNRAGIDAKIAALKKLKELKILTKRRVYRNGRFRKEALFI
jgi:hypothetical protein